MHKEPKWTEARLQNVDEAAKLRVSLQIARGQEIDIDQQLTLGVQPVEIQGATAAIGSRNQILFEIPGGPALVQFWPPCLLHRNDTPSLGVDKGLGGTDPVRDDRMGHIMKYGDGVYGGIFISVMYTQAFFARDIREVVESGLKAIPAQSCYAQLEMSSAGTTSIRTTG